MSGAGSSPTLYTELGLIRTLPCSLSQFVAHWLLGLLKVLSFPEVFPPF